MAWPKCDLPFALDHPRVWRTYLGGDRLDGQYGISMVPEEQGHFPEEWIASVVPARNVGREQIRDEGLSHLANSDSTLRSILESDPEGFLGKPSAQTGVLIKIIDAQERLTIQVHPDRTTAMQLFDSPYGKTECWHILDGPAQTGAAPCVYLGFREGITEAHWRELFEKQDIEGMLACLHRFEVHPGDTILIEGGVPHAIGNHCFLIEIQEPTDYTIRVERTTPSGMKLADASCHQGIGFEKMFSCFHYEGLSREEIQKRWFLPGRTLVAQGEGVVRELVGSADTPFFSMHLLDTQDQLEVENDGFCGLYLLEGDGRLVCTGGEIPIQVHTQYFVPAGVKRFTLCASQGGHIRAMRFFGPKV